MQYVVVLQTINKMTLLPSQTSMVRSG